MLSLVCFNTLHQGQLLVTVKYSVVLTGGRIVKFWTAHRHYAETSGENLNYRG